MKKAKHTGRLKGPRKAVVLLTLIGRSFTPKVFACLSPGEREKLLTEKKRMGKASPSEKSAVLKEFSSLMRRNKTVIKAPNLSLTIAFALFTFVVFLIYLTEYRVRGLMPVTHIMDIGGVYLLIFPALVYLSPQYFGERFFRMTFQSRRRVTDTYYAMAGAALLFALMTLNTYMTSQPLQAEEKGGYLLVLLMIAGFFAPVIEEFVFRKMIHGFIRGKSNLYAGAVISSLVFAFVHPPFNPITFISYFLAGLVLVFLYEQRGNLYAPIMAHSAGNLLMILVEIMT